METTSKCNATCPMCLRSVSGGALNPHLPLTELTLADVQSSLSERFVRQLSKLYMCGNYGDPAAASESLEIFEWLRSVNPSIRLEIFSNGGLRSESYWTKLASVIDKAVFAIDGLEHTNHLYRKGVAWSKVEKNVKAFMQAGGKARWDFIVFRHNEHQVEEARELASMWGVQEFQVKKTGRFFSNAKTARKDEQVVLDKDGEVEYTIQLPKNPKYVNAGLLTKSLESNKITENRSAVPASHLSSFSKEKVAKNEVANQIEKAPIDCKVAAERSIYLTAEGFALPCCWLAIRMYPWYQKPKTGELWKMFDRLEAGLNELNAVLHGIERVIESPFFQSDMPESWSKPSFDSGKLFACAKTCGRKDFDLFKSQFEESLSGTPAS